MSEKLCKLYDLRNGDKFKVVDDEDLKVPPASNEFDLSDIFRFDHLDGMYSYCTDMKGTVHHFAAWTNVRKVS